MLYTLLSPFVSSYSIRDFFKKSRKTHYSRASHYEYRKISPHRVQVKFNYALDKIYFVDNKDVL